MGLGSGIRKNPTPGIPDPGSRVTKAPDTGSATLPTFIFKNGRKAGRKIKGWKAEAGKIKVRLKRETQES